MKALFHFFTGLTFAFLISISLSSQLYASDCDCNKTGAYVKSSKGVAPKLNKLSDTEALSPGGNYRVVSGGSNGQYVITIYRVDGNQQLFQIPFLGDAEWGFSPDDHRFAIWSLPDQTQHIIQLYNLEGISPGTPVLNEFFSSGQGNEASVRFSPNGNYFVYALITGTNSTFFMAADSKTGEVKYETTFNYSTAPGIDEEKYGGGFWGFGPDPNDNDLLLAYLTSGNQQLKWQLMNLSLPVDSTVVYNPGSYSVTSAYWVFSRCGDVLASVTQIPTNVNLRLIKTTDGTESELYSYYSPIFLQTTTTQHQVRYDESAFADLSPKYPNTAGQPCSGNDVTPPSWPAGKMLTASSVTTTSVQLDWTPASSETAKYKIFKDDVPLDSVSFNIQSYHVDALQPGTDYNFRIEAADSAGNYTTDGPTVEITTLAPDITPPVWPDTTIFKVHLYSSGSIRLYWTNATDNVEVKYYRTYLNDTLYNQFNADPNSTDYYQNLSGLVSGRIYTIDVVAVDDYENVSTDGPSRTITFNPDATPQWPGNTILEAKNIDVTTAELHWTAPDYDFAIMAYRVCNDAGSCRDIYAPDYLHDPDTTYLLNNLEPDSAYAYTVVAYGDNYVYSDQSPQVEFRTLADNEPPEWPLGSSLSICETGTDYVALRWDPASDNVGVTNYQVFQDDILINTIENSYPEPKTYKVGGLQPGDTYIFRIVAGDGSDNYSNQNLSANAQTYDGPIPNQAFPNTSYAYRVIHGERTYLVDLNDSGQVIGNDINTGLGFIWENDSSRSLGTLGRPDISPYFINNNGEISGEARMTSGNYMPFFWRNDTISSLGPVIPAANWTVPTAMNDSGVVVGWARYASIFSAGFEKAFSWKYDVLGRDLGTLGGEIYIPSYNRVESRAIDVNNQGQIVGYSPAAVDSQAIRHGFIWENGQMRDLDSSRYLYPIAINDNGHVLVTEGVTAASKLMVWNSSGSTKTIGTLGGPRSNGKDITENGFVYGSSQTDHVSCDGSYSEHAFIWNGNDIIDLGTMGGANSMALDMNKNGQVVGEAELFNGQKHAFLWQNGIMIDLNPDGYDESTAVKINELGQVIINAFVNQDTVYDEGGEPRIKQVRYGLIANPVQLPDINIDSADTLHFCPGESFNVNYSISNGSFLPDNQFFIVLSDSMSNFVSPISLQTEKVSDGVLRGTLPVPFMFSNVDSGSYSIRVISSNPVNFSNEYAINARFGSCSSYITIGSTGSQFCAGDSLDIPFTVAGSDFNPGNTFAAMLSDSLGDFSKETEIGTLQNTTTGIIAAMIPENISAGSSYRIRIKASAPVVVSQDNGFDIAISQVPTAEISQKGDTLAASPGDAWIWMRDADTLSMDTRSIVAAQAGNYKVTVFYGGCSAESEPFSFSIDGINQGSLKNGIRISPNPSTGKVHIKASDEIKAGELTISVYDITGGLITRFHWNKYKNEKVYTFDLGSQPDGLYFISIMNPGEAVYVSKIIIQH